MFFSLVFDGTVIATSYMRQLSSVTELYHLNNKLLKAFDCA